MGTDTHQRLLSRRAVSPATAVLPSSPGREGTRRASGTAPIAPPSAAEGGKAPGPPISAARLPSRAVAPTTVVADAAANTCMEARHS